MTEGPLFNKTRIAPTPSGFLHLGNVLSFAITAAIAKKTKAKIFLRIDDLDRERINDRYVQDIFDTLNFLEIPWDEGPRNFAEYASEYSQLHRMDLYRSALKQLREQGELFACTCSRTQMYANSPGVAYPGTCRDRHIPFDTERVKWRVRTPAATQIALKTLEGTIIESALPAIMRDFFVKKKDGFPAYQLTSVLDDVYFGIDLVVRGEDLWPSTWAQLYLAGLLGADAFRRATFYHHLLLNGPDGNKLSKSAGSTSVQYLRKEHKKPADIFQLVAGAMGFERPVTNWEELVELMNIKLHSGKL